MRWMAVRRIELKEGTSDEVARLASIAQPKKLVLYHGLFYGTEESTVLEEIEAPYEGNVFLAHDLDMFTSD